MRCFVGIDLGTARSGYSYAFSSEPASIKHPSQYTSEDGPSSKTDTALLFEVAPEGPPGPQQWRLDSWGTAAVNKYEPYRPLLFVTLQLVMHSGKLLVSSCCPHDTKSTPFALWTPMHPNVIRVTNSAAIAPRYQPTNTPHMLPCPLQVHEPAIWRGWLPVSAGDGQAVQAGP